jgi:hypothetical protein
MTQVKQLYGGAINAFIPPNSCDVRYIIYHSARRLFENSLKWLGISFCFFCFFVAICHQQLHSDMRQVPDNQEVFANTHTDQSIIFDILEYVTQPSCDEDAIKYIVRAAHIHRNKPDSFIFK